MAEQEIKRSQTSSKGQSFTPLPIPPKQSTDTLQPNSPEIKSASQDLSQLKEEESIFEKSKSSRTSIRIPSPTHLGQTAVIFENRNKKMSEHSGFDGWLKNELLIRKINPETYPALGNLLASLPGPSYVIELLNVID